MRAIVGGEPGELQITYETGSAKIRHGGTAFDLTVTSLGVTKLLLLEGQVTLCGKDEGDDCETVATPCALLQTESGEDVEEIGPGERRVQETLDHFPFQTSDSTLPDEFQFAGLGCTNGAGPIAPSPLDGPPVWIPAAAAGAAAAAAIILCVVFCDSGPDTNNKTN